MEVLVKFGLVVELRVLTLDRLQFDGDFFFGAGVDRRVDVSESTVTYLLDRHVLVRSS